MKVKELIEALQKVDSERDIVLCGDNDGNGYSLMDSDIDTESIFVDDGEGTIYPEALTPILKEAGYTKEDMFNEDSYGYEYITPIKVVVFWPT